MASGLYLSCEDDVKRGNIDFDTDTFYGMLVTSAYTFDQDNHTKRSQITNEVAATGNYVAGGFQVTVSVTKTAASNQIDVTLGGFVINSATVTARGVAYYKRRGGASTADELVAFNDFGADVVAVTGDRKVLPQNFGPERIQKMMHWANLVQNPMRLERRRIRRIQNTIICGDMILYDAPSFYDTYTLTPYFPYFRRGVTRGAVEDLLDPQREKNKRRSIEIELVTKTSNGGWKVHKDSMNPIQKRNLRNFGSAPGFIMEWEGEAHQEPKQIAPAAPPVAHERLEQKADVDMMKISGINESAMGQIDKVQSGRAIESRQRQAVVALQMYFDNFSRTKQLCGEKRLEIIQTHYTEQRLFRILGEDGKIATRIINERQKVLDPNTGQPIISPITFNPVERIVNDVTLGKYIATVDETPMSANFLNAQFEEMMTLMEKLGPAMLKGAIATVDGVVIYAHNKVFNTSGLAGGSKWGAAGAVDGAQAMLLGAQAGGVALLGNVFWRESDNTDYGNKQGIGVGRKIGMLKPRFKSIFDANSVQDFGTLAVKTAAAAQ